MNYILKNEFYTVTVSSVGAEIISIKSIDGKELLWQNNLGEGWADHAPILFPFAGRLKNGEYFYKGNAYKMQIHGFARQSEYTLKSASDKKLVLKLKSSEQTRKIYPFDFSLTVIYKLVGKKIKLLVNVENTGAETLPYAFGWHPGFILPTDNGQDIEDYSVKFKDKKLLTRALTVGTMDDERLFEPYPVSNSEYKFSEKEIYEADTMIFLEAGNEVTLKADGHPYELNMSWSENLPVLCLWKIAKSEAKFICIEPWTHLVARGERSNYLEERPMNRLAPGEADNYEYSIEFHL